MVMQDKKTIDMLTTDNVSVLTQKFIELDGVKTQAGNNHRRSYSNSEQGRQKLMQKEPQNVVNAVLALWGNEPTITEDNQEEPAETGDGGDEPAE